MRDDTEATAEDRAKLARGLEGLEGLDAEIEDLDAELATAHGEDHAHHDLTDGQVMADLEADAARAMNTSLEAAANMIAAAMRPKGRLELELELETAGLPRELAHAYVRILDEFNPEGAEQLLAVTWRLIDQDGAPPIDAWHAALDALITEFMSVNPRAARVIRARANRNIAQAKIAMMKKGGRR